MAMSPERSRISRHSLLIRPAGIGALAQLVEDAAAHLGGGLARERDGEDVRWIDAAAQQVEIAIDEHMGLARACRRLEHHVVGGIDGPRTRCGVAIGQIGTSDVGCIWARSVGLWTTLTRRTAASQTSPT